MPLFPLGLALIAGAAAEIDWPTLRLTPVVTGLIQPTTIANAEDGTDRLFIIEQPGTIRILQGSNLLSEPFLNITNRVQVFSEQGLLGMAFPLHFAAKKCFYVNY